MDISFIEQRIGISFQYMPNVLPFYLNDYIGYLAPKNAEQLMFVQREFCNFCINENLISFVESSIGKGKKYKLEPRGQRLRELKSWDKLIKKEKKEKLTISRKNWKERNWLPIAIVSYVRSLFN